MRVLTWNLYWKAMNSVIPRCIDDKCLRKIDYTLKRYYDFICLQEAANYQSLTALDERYTISHKIDENVLVTYYDGSKYYLNRNVKGTMKDNNRLFMISFFNNRLAIINVHAGHDHDIDNLQTYILQYINEADHKRLQSYDIILLGDFNDNIKDIDLFGRKITGSKTVPTCCYSYSGNKFYSKYTPDHILSNMHINETIVHDISDASDHKPVSADINLTWLHGYDFDGVIQKSVGPVNEKGERNQIYPLIPSKKILDQINKQLRNGDKIVAITARAPYEKNEIIPFTGDIPVYFTHGNHKTNYLFKLGVNSYYDDSPMRIDNIIKNRDMLPLLEELYMVYPESDKIDLIIN